MELAWPLEGLLAVRASDVPHTIVNGASHAQISTGLPISQQTVKAHGINISKNYTP